MFIKIEENREKEYYNNIIQQFIKGKVWLNKKQLKYVINKKNGVNENEKEN